MPFEVYDYRVDVRNVVITPEIRARFIRMEPGTHNVRHSHDLGQEVFLVLDGQVEFEIAGQQAVLGPGQMCVAYRDELHSIRCVGELPATYYLSVTPHIEPTHTHWDEHGAKRPPSYGSAARAERARHDPSAGKTTDALAAEHVAAARALADVASRNAEAQATGAADVRTALAVDDAAAAKQAVDAMWARMYRTFKAMRALETAWNEFTPRFGAG